MTTDITSSPTSLSSLLASSFGHPAFLPHQEQTIHAILSGQDVFAVMPTGGGKSLCYQLPAHCLEGMCVVISPLISLMKDQVDQMRRKGARAEYLNSSLDFEAQLKVMKKIQDGEVDLLYVVPERFAMPGFRKTLTNVHLSLFAIDEAHCVSEWGHDFRPEYLNLSRIVHDFPDVPVAAFTATATMQVQNDTIRRLGLRKPHTVRASFNRSNLYYETIPKHDANEQILHFLRSRAGQSGIVYRTTRKSVEETAEFLTWNGIESLPYHAGLDRERRKEHQDAFIQGRCRVIVATIAFGMGIDKPDVRFVVHGDLPKSVSGFYQETGRAGRDGEPSHCLLLFGRHDVSRLEYFIGRIEDPRQKQAASRRLDEIIAYAKSGGCHRQWLLSYFGETLSHGQCGGCGTCQPDQRAFPEVGNRKPMRSAMGLPETVVATMQLLRRGLSRFQVARMRRLKPATIASHVAQLIQAGAEDVDRHVNQTKRLYLERLFSRLGSTQLHPIVEASHGRIDFDDARLVRAALQRDTDRQKAK